MNDAEHMKFAYQRMKSGSKSSIIIPLVQGCKIQDDRLLHDPQQLYIQWLWSLYSKILNYDTLKALNNETHRAFVSSRDPFVFNNARSLLGTGTNYMINTIMYSQWSGGQYTSETYDVNKSIADLLYMFRRAFALLNKNSILDVKITNDKPLVDGVLIIDNYGDVIVTLIYDIQRGYYSSPLITIYNTYNNDCSSEVIIQSSRYLGNHYNSSLVQNVSIQAHIPLYSDEYMCNRSYLRAEQNEENTQRYRLLYHLGQQYPIHCDSWYNNHQFFDDYINRPFGKEWDKEVLTDLKSLIKEQLTNAQDFLKQIHDKLDRL